jgi:hypothetical protein
LRGTPVLPSAAASPGCHGMFRLGLPEKLTLSKCRPLFIQ